MKANRTSFGSYASPLIQALAILAQKRASANENHFSATGGIVGDPFSDLRGLDAAQGFPDTCAIKCQEAILQQFFAMDFEEAELRQISFENGWYSPGGGTLPSHVGCLLEQAGIPITRREGANVADLIKSLSEGKKIIIGVDGGELRNNSSLAEFFEETLQGANADHAVLVSGIDTRNSPNLAVLITDPATGMTSSYPVSDFAAAWQDSSCFMMETNIPSPMWDPGMECFPYSMGHVNEIGSIPYDELLGGHGHLFTTPVYESPFDLSEFFSVIPEAFGTMISQYCRASSMSVPANWQDLCTSNEEWLAGLAESNDMECPDLADNGEFTSGVVEFIGNIVGSLA